MQLNTQPTDEEILEQLSDENIRHIHQTESIGYIMQFIEAEVLTSENINPEETTLYEKLCFFEKVRYNEEVREKVEWRVVCGIIELLEEIGKNGKEGFMTVDDIEKVRKQNYAGWDNWETCSTCKGYGSVYDMWLEFHPVTGEPVLESGYVDCKNPDCFAGHVYVSDEVFRARQQKIATGKMGQLKGKPVTLGDIFPDVFLQIRAKISKGYHAS